MRTSFTVSYDSVVDTLYITKRSEVPFRGHEDTSGIIWKYDRNGELIAAVVMDFKDRWEEQQSELAMLLSEHFHIPPLQADRVLDHALGNVPRHL